MAITTMDSLVAGLSGQQGFQFSKGSFTQAAAGAFMSLFMVAGAPGAGTNPSSGMSGAVPTNATGGTFPFTNPTGGQLSYLSKIDAISNGAGTLILYDRLFEQSGIAPTTTTAQTINSTALTRFTDGVGVEAWLQVYATMGAGGPTPTLSYTNEGNTASRTATCVGYAASAVTHRNFPFQLQAGDEGIKSIQSYTSSVSMTSGTIGLVLRKRLATIPMQYTNVATVLDAFATGLVKVPDDACLEFMFQCTGTGATYIMGSLTLVQG